ncbi:MAG: histidine kinase [Nocardioidaceae bacterium]|nr:histidine kinase [Nocardioidaceae bacterium]
MGSDPAGTAVVSTLFRAIAVLRVVVLVNTVVLYAYRYDRYPHAATGAWALAGLTVWTLVALWAYDDARRRRWPLLVTDLAVAVGAILLSPYVKGDGLNATLPGFWVMGVVLAWAAAWRLTGGLVSAVLISAADLSVRDEITLSRWPNIFLLVLGGVVVGFLSDLLQRTAAERDRAERAAAAAAERQRLGRVVHDGVLQVLALVQKRGSELGGEAAELGRLAGEQEVALRAYVQRETSTPAEGTPYDLGGALAALGTSTVTVALPATPVRVDPVAGVEIAAVVAECLSNVRHHVGRDAPAWVLLEDLGGELVVSVRDQGPGIPEGRLAEAAAQGRLGVASSIRGRIEDLGGTATLETGSFGTEWEFRVPVR